MNAEVERILSLAYAAAQENADYWHGHREGAARWVESKTYAALRDALDVLADGLRFYSDGCHFSHDDAWDTVSGEPRNFWCDEAGTATVEDGSVARAALEGKRLPDGDEASGPDGEGSSGQHASAPSGASKPSEGA